MAEPTTLRIAAAGDIHCGRESACEHLPAAVARAAETADLFLLAGDLTTHGEPEQGAILARAFEGVEVPVVTVLGNHDWHVNRPGELRAVLEEGGLIVLDRSHTILDVRGVEVGIAGTKGFVGGFTGHHIPDFGEPSLRGLYAESMAEAHALDEGLRAIAACPLRVALMHYAPTCETLVGERREIWSFLGTDRLAAPITEHGPDVVLHGHAHAGTFEGSISGVPVYNVAVPVLGQDFWEFELSVSSAHAPTALR